MRGRIAIVYSSRHGHVRAIAERLAAVAAIRRLDCALFDAARATSASLDDVDAVVIAGSVHFGRHSAALRRFVGRALPCLKTIPSAFVSVSGSAASLEGRAKAEEYMAGFLRVTGWTPDVTLSIAGAVQYTKYGPFTRLLMKFAARTAGRGTDTSRDYDYTNWALLDQFMHHFVETLERHGKLADAERSAARAL